jgi:3-hydroxybutyryl-CoA dehydrogenase
MAIDTSNKKTRLGIIGAGLMGHALAQLFAMQGHPVALYDNDQSVLEKAPVRIRNNFGKFLEVGLASFSGFDQLVYEFARCHT